MKKLAILLTALSLSACATTSLNSGKALALAWQGLDAAAVSADEMVNLGRLKGAQAATVAADLRKARAALQVATDAGTAAGSTVDPGAQIAIASAATAEVLAIVADVKGK